MDYFLKFDWYHLKIVERKWQKSFHSHYKRDIELYLSRQFSIFIIGKSFIFSITVFKSSVARVLQSELQTSEQYSGKVVSVKLLITFPQVVFNFYNFFLLIIEWRKILLNNFYETIRASIFSYFSGHVLILFLEDSRL